MPCHDLNECLGASNLERNEQKGWKSWQKWDNSGHADGIYDLRGMSGISIVCCALFPIDIPLSVLTSIYQCTPVAISCLGARVLGSITWLSQTSCLCYALLFLPWPLSFPLFFCYCNVWYWDQVFNLLTAVHRRVTVEVGQLSVFTAGMGFCVHPC